MIADVPSGGMTGIVEPSTVGEAITTVSVTDLGWNDGVWWMKEVVTSVVSHTMLAEQGWRNRSIGASIGFHRRGR